MFRVLHYLDFIIRVFMCWFVVCFIIHYLFVVLLVLFHEALFYLLYLFMCNGASTNAFFRIKLEYWWMAFYLFIHFRLGKERLILFIMPEPSVTNNINEDIFMECLSVFDSDLHASIQKIWLICIDMNNWGTDNFSDLCAIIRWSSLPRVRCESNLIIHYNMNNSSSCIIY